MSASSRLYFEIFESAHQEHEDAKDFYYYSLAEAKEDREWNQVLGKCLDLVYTVLLEQNDTTASAFTLYHQSKLYAVKCIQSNEEPTLEGAYQSMGYEMGQTKEELATKSIIEIPF